MSDFAENATSSTTTEQQASIEQPSSQGIVQQIRTQLEERRQEIPQEAQSLYPVLDRDAWNETYGSGGEVELNNEGQIRLCRFLERYERKQQQKNPNFSLTAREASMILDTLELNYDDGQLNPSFWGPNPSKYNGQNGEKIIRDIFTNFRGHIDKYEHKSKPSEFEDELLHRAFQEWSEELSNKETELVRKKMSQLLPENAAKQKDIEEEIAPLQQRVTVLKMLDAVISNKLRGKSKTVENMIEELNTLPATNTVESSKFLMLELLTRDHKIPFALVEGKINAHLGELKGKSLTPEDQALQRRLNQASLIYRTFSRQGIESVTQAFHLLEEIEGNAKADAKVSEDSTVTNIYLGTAVSLDDALSYILETKSIFNEVLENVVLRDSSILDTPVPRQSSETPYQEQSQAAASRSPDPIPQPAQQPEPNSQPLTPDASASSGQTENQEVRETAVVLVLQNLEEKKKGLEEMQRQPRFDVGASLEAIDRQIAFVKKIPDKTTLDEIAELLKKRDFELDEMSRDDLHRAINAVKPLYKAPVLTPASLHPDQQGEGNKQQSTPPDSQRDSESTNPAWEYPKSVTKEQKDKAEQFMTEIASNGMVMFLGKFPKKWPFSYSTRESKYGRFSDSMTESNGGFSPLLASVPQRELFISRSYDARDLSKHVSRLTMHTIQENHERSNPHFNLIQFDKVVPNILMVEDYKCPTSSRSFLNPQTKMKYTVPEQSVQISFMTMAPGVYNLFSDRISDRVPITFSMVVSKDLARKLLEEQRSNPYLFDMLSKEYLGKESFGNDTDNQLMRIPADRLIIQNHSKEFDLPHESTIAYPAIIQM